MKLSQATQKAVQTGKRVKVTQGQFKPNQKVAIYVQPADDFDNTNGYLKNRRISKIASELGITQDDKEQESQAVSQYFTIQVVETGAEKMTDVDPDLNTDVFDEEVFDDYHKAQQWLSTTGYFS